jgi:NAD(P)-dependent dehydrogenase (short-subunit alcohol dehydrogenase family)
MAAERVFVTGANRGIGLEYVRQYLERGAWVFAGCRRPGEAHDLAELSQQNEWLKVLHVDVTDGSTIDAAMAEMSADGGCLDVVVNNAGVSPKGERFSNVEAEGMLSVFEVNTVAPLIVAQKAMALLGRASRPRVVNISSSMGSLTQKDYGRHYSYGASKAALKMMTRAAAHDLAESGISVAALHPGWVRTDLGGSHAALSARESVAGMIGVIDQLTLDNSSYLFNWRGEQQPW